jgi:hypothetical protein
MGTSPHPDATEMVQTIASAPPFDSLDLRAALKFHMAYYYSWQMQLGHIVLCHIYLFFALIMTAAGGPFVLIGAVLLMWLYFLLLARSLVGIAYVPLIVLPIAWRAFQFAHSLMLQRNRKDSLVPPGWERTLLLVFGTGGAALTLAALELCKRVFEPRFRAPPHRLHRLLAAPVLEWMHLWLIYESWSSSRASFFMRRIPWWGGKDLRDLRATAAAAREAPGQRIIIVDAADVASGLGPAAPPRRKEAPAQSKQPPSNPKKAAKAKARKID